MRGFIMTFVGVWALGAGFVAGVFLALAAGAPGWLAAVVAVPFGMAALIGVSAALASWEDRD